jgi:Flp pilus assembly protein TadB
MTAGQEENAGLTTKLRRRAWVTAGATFLASSIVISWAVGGTWVLVVLIGIVIGCGVISRPWASGRRAATPPSPGGGRVRSARP